MTESGYAQINDASSDDSHHKHHKMLLEHADHEDRLGFVKKVYAILLAQLTVTFGFVAIVKSNVTLNDSIND